MIAEVVSLSTACGINFHYTRNRAIIGLRRADWLVPNDW